MHVHCQRFERSAGDAAAHWSPPIGRLLKAQLREWTEHTGLIKVSRSTPCRSACPSFAQAFAQVCIWLPQVTLALVLTIGVYMYMSGNAEGRLMQQLSARRSALHPAWSHQHVDQTSRSSKQPC